MSRFWEGVTDVAKKMSKSSKKSAMKGESKREEKREGRKGEAAERKGKKT